MATSLKSLCATACAGLALAAAAPAAAHAAPDPLLADQWALSDATATGAEEAWTQSTGTGIVVAVLDSGIELDHPDLAANVWTNPGEIPANGIDDDADGIVDDVHGANMFDHSANVEDDNDHGTHVAGIVAARRDNGIGGSGIAPTATILPVKVLDDKMAGTTDTLVDGIRYAVDRGARILNVSISTDYPTDSLAAAASYAGAHGAIIVASAGNSGRDIDLQPSYPAALTDPAVLSVAADTSNGSLWSLSNIGTASVDLAAPGESIISTARGSSFQSRTGTSAAAPFVAGSLALLSAARPDLPMSALRDVILDTTRRSSALASVLSHGRLDVAAAMHRVLPGPAWKAAPVATAAHVPTLRLRTRSSVRAGSRLTLRWSAGGADDVRRWRVLLDGRVVTTLPARTAVISRSVTRPGGHTWRVAGIDAGGAKIVTARRAFRVLPRRS